jgi:hypothetical protein
MKVRTQSTEGLDQIAPAPSADTGYVLVFVLQNSFHRFRSVAPSQIEQHDEFGCNSIKYYRQFMGGFLFVLKLISASGIMKAL